MSVWFCFVKQKTAYEMRISDWSSDVCSSDLIAIALRRGRREMTGSRTGMVGSLKIYVPGPGGYQQIDGSKFYDARYWEPEKYQQWHDAIWQQPRIGRVTVGEVEQADGP